MKDETDPPNPPTLRSVSLSKRKRGQPVTRELYDQMCDAYIRGARSIGGIAKATGVTVITAKRAINVGWPVHGWAPLKERAAFYDKLHADSTNKESPARAKEARDFLKMREEYLQIAHGVRSALAQELGVILPAIPNSTPMTTRPVRQVHYEEELDEKGRVTKRTPKTITVDVQMPVSVIDLVAATAQIANALDRTGGGELEQLLARPPAQGKRKHNLSTEQIRFMAENNGQLPTGVKLEDLGDG